MKLSPYVQGAAGGLIGMIFATPLVMHWGWMKLVGTKAIYPQTRPEFLCATALVLPVLFILGLTGTFIISAYLAYQCWEADSLSPIQAIIQEPYHYANNSADRATNIVAIGTLLGYTLPATFLVFTLLDQAFGGGLGLLAVPGQMLLQACFGAATTSTTAFFGSLAISWFSSFIGMAIAGAYTKYKEFYPGPAPYSEEGAFKSVYTRLINSDENESRLQPDNGPSPVPSEDRHSPALPAALPAALSAARQGDDEPSPAPTGYTQYHDVPAGDADSVKDQQPKPNNPNFSELGQQARVMGQTVIHSLTARWNSLQLNSIWPSRNPIPKNTDVELPLLHASESTMDPGSDGDRSEVSFELRPTSQQPAPLPSPFPSPLSSPRARSPAFPQ